MCKELDLYGKTIGFRVNGRNKTHSNCGAVLSLIVYLSTFILVLQRILLQASDHHRHFITHTDDFEEAFVSQTEIAALKDFNVGFGIISDVPVEQDGYGYWKVV